MAFLKSEIFARHGKVSAGLKTVQGRFSNRGMQLVIGHFNIPIRTFGVNQHCFASNPSASLDMVYLLVFLHHAKIERINLIVPDRVCQSQALDFGQTFECRQQVQHGKTKRIVA